MSTPPPNGTAKRKVKMTAATKQDTIDNFDLEVASRLEMITSIHSSLLSSFLTRQETAIQRIPLEMRRMTVKEIGDRWSGGIRGVMDGLTRGRLEEEGRKEEGEGGKELRKEGEKGGGKRKRPTTASSLSLTQEKESRMPKSARKNPYTDATQSTPGPSTSSKPTFKSTKNPSPTKPSSSNSTLPAPSASTFKFNPHLPSTPLLTNANGYRRPRRNESIAMSTNGSPLILGGADDGEDEENEGGEGSGSGSEEDGSEEEKLLDEEEEMRRLDGKVNGKGKEKGVVLSAGKKGKGRISTIQLHPSATTTTSSSLPSFSRTHPTSPSAFDLVIPIPLPNGQTLSFNALSDSPTKLDEILRGGEHGGVPLVSDEERGRIRGQIDRSVRMLGERLGKWKLGGS